MLHPIRKSCKRVYKSRMGYARHTLMENRNRLLQQYPSHALPGREDEKFFVSGESMECDEQTEL